MSNNISSTQEKSEHKILHGDPIIWIIFFLLCTISIVEVYSATSSLSYKDGRYWSPVVQHAIYLAIGTLIVYIVHNIKCRWFKLYPLFVLPVSFILLLLVFAIGVSTNGANRYIDFFGIHFQPSELAKGAVVIAVAIILASLQTSHLKGRHKEPVIQADRHAFKYILCITIPFCLVIFPENFSTAALLFLGVFLLMLVGRVPLQQIGKLLGSLA